MDEMQEKIRRLKSIKIAGQSINTEQPMEPAQQAENYNQPVYRKRRRKKRPTKNYNSVIKEMTNHINKPTSEQEINMLLEKFPTDKSPALHVVLKNKIKNFFYRIWNTIHHPIKQNWLTLLMIVFLTIIVSVTFTKVFFPSDVKSTEQFGLLPKLQTLKQSHDYYTKMATKDEMLMSWVKLFSNWRYAVGGDPRYNNGDCVGAVHEFFKQWNSNIAFEDINAIISRCKSLEERGEMKRRMLLSDVHNGDLIIFNFGPQTPKHVGIVYDGVNGFVRYMDVNGYTLTWGMERVRFGDKSIHAIYEVSYSFWIGDVMKTISSK